MSLYFIQETSENLYQIEMWESTPYVELFFQATVPISCSGCSATIQLGRHWGLTVSSCSVTFAASDPPLTNHSLRVRAVQNAGSYSRIVGLEFATVSSNEIWNGYSLPDVFVSYFITEQNSVCVIVTCTWLPLMQFCLM